jgi:membrane-bound lytic murein transglycosylase F
MIKQIRDNIQSMRAVLMTVMTPQRLRALTCACLSLFILLASSQSTATNPRFNVHLLSVPDQARDLEDIYKSGRLRVLYLEGASGELPVPKGEQEMLARFASENDLALEWLAAANDWNMLSGLATGYGDIVVGQGKSLQAGIEGQARFTVPWGASYEQIVIRAGSPTIQTKQDLLGRRVALKTSSSLWPELLDLASGKDTDTELVELAEDSDIDQVMRRLSAGKYDAAIINREAIEQFLPAYPELTVAFNLSSSEPRVWTVSGQAPQLQFALNEFLNKNHLQFNLADRYLDDLPRLQDKRILRMITYKNPVNYYFADGRFHGFEYDLLKKFAKDKRMRVEVVLADTHEQMLEMLLRGEGDVIAASLPNFAYENEGVRFSAPYNYSAPMVVGQSRGEELLDLRDLQGKKIVLPARSPYFSQLKQLQKQYGYKLVKEVPGVDTSTILSRITDGAPYLTVINQQMFHINISDNGEVKAYFPLSESQPHGWAVRKNNEQLLSALNKFVEKEYRGKYYNTLYANYFDTPLQEEDFYQVFATVEELSPYDALVREYAEQYEFDWRLIVAQMFQESQFDPQAVSYAGAEGLMQVLPSTAEWIGFDKIDDPATNIRAGIEYMHKLRQQFESDLPLEERTWFTLAAYNAGFARISQARQLAEKMGLDPNRWFGNVDKAMLKLAKPYNKNGKKVRVCRCGQTVVYVSEIRALYNTYVRFTKHTQLARLDARHRNPLDI